jgi:hypothetical protein
MDTVTFARWYAKRNIPIFPCCTIEDGVCSCGKKDCKSPGKHPVFQCAPHGVLDATTDPSSIAQWWALFPDSNIGIATGSISGLVVIDIDPGHGGEDAWQNLENANETIPDTWWVETGSGGFHIYFTDNSGDIRNSASAVGPGIDVRGENGYVIAPPSKHISGGDYNWSELYNPQTVKHPASIPDWLMSRVSSNRSRSFQRTGPTPIPDKITEGGRNMWMASIAGTMRRRGMSLEAVEAALQIENRMKCTPPLDRQEVKRIAWSIDRYPAAVSGLHVNGVRASA